MGLQHGAQRWRGAWIDRDRENAVRDSLAVQAVNASALASENEQLRKLMGLARRLETGFIAAEALQSSDRSDVVTSVVLSAGANAGVRRYNPVVAPEGLVGVVVTADPTMSVANLYTHPDFRPSAMTADASAFGIVRAHLDQGIVSRDRNYLLELRGVSDRIVLAPGTRIYTSGLGGTMPRGIAIGTVLRQLDATEGLSRNYLLQPAVNPGRITSVLILTTQRVTQGVGNVWTSAAAADSAAQRVVAASDSLLREASLMEARARAAVIDSIRMAAGDSLRRVIIDSIRRASTPAPTTRVPPPDTTTVRPAKTTLPSPSLRQPRGRSR
jgi:cell shape-determining protein MreC